MTDKKEDKTTYEVFGLSERSIRKLTERFGDAVHSVEDDMIVVDLTNVEAQLMVHDQYHLKQVQKPQQP